MNRFLTIWIACLTTICLMAQEPQSAKPKSGEGISAFLERNGRPSKKYYQEFLKLNERKLRGKKELQLGVTYLLPPLSQSENVKQKVVTAKELKEPLFGKELSRVKVTGNSLAGACFYVVSGHGGPDPGAIGKLSGHNLHEDEYAYDVALRLARNLMQEGAKVHIVIQDAKDGIRNGRYLKNSKRETCMGAKIPLNQTERLKQRAAKINELYRSDRKKYTYCRAIFLHVDSRSKRQQTDVFFYHAPGSKQGERLAKNIRNTFQANYKKHQPNRGFEGTVDPRGLYVLRNSTPVGVLVELGNIQNNFDQRRFVISDNRQALAKWLMEGFIKDYKAGK
ncbi:MAG: N-acetylmuramoyl-L-alanine amidase [Mediterranea massiliensis]|nr:N-acetylmuramoyl-L-alanine amidase [Mediterranea massiliensis]